MVDGLWASTVGVGWGWITPSFLGIISVYDLVLIYLPEEWLTEEHVYRVNFKISLFYWDNNIKRGVVEGIEVGGVEGVVVLDDLDSAGQYPDEEVCNRWC